LSPVEHITHQKLKKLAKNFKPVLPKLIQREKNKNFLRLIGVQKHIILIVPMPKQIEIVADV